MLLILQYMSFLQMKAQYYWDEKESQSPLHPSSDYRQDEEGEIMATK